MEEGHVEAGELEEGVLVFRKNLVHFLEFSYQSKKAPLQPPPRTHPCQH